MEKFRKLNLSEPFLQTIKGMHFQIPSEIQEKTIPLTLEGKDVIAGSATGSGKTLAFGACIVETLVVGNGLQSLILTPTRELAEQVAESLQAFSMHKKLKIIAVYGGVGIEPQIKNLKDADVVVGTPGRILDHMQRYTINLSKIKILVLDEADRMLDMGFLEDVEKIIEKVPKNRQTLLFSATISSEVSIIAQRHMKNPIEVSAETHVDPTKLKQIFYDVDSGIKFSVLVHLLKEEKSDLVLVFCNTRNNADFVTKNLRLNDIDAKVIHGGLSQNRRSDVLEDFHQGHVTVLVCTDVAARGLDIKGVSHVYNYDVPSTSKDYIHRIGRTARAGKEGKAIAIIAQRDYENFQNVLKDDTIKIERQELPYIPRAVMQIDRNNRKGGFKTGGRGFRERSGRGNYAGRGERESKERGFGDRKGFGNSRGRDNFRRRERRY